MLLWFVIFMHSGDERTHLRNSFERRNQSTYKKLVTDYNFLNNKSVLHPLVIIGLYKYNRFYRSKYVRNDASRYKCQLLSDANQCIVSLTFFCRCTEQIGEFSLPSCIYIYIYRERVYLIYIYICKHICIYICRETALWKRLLWTHRTALSETLRNTSSNSNGHYTIMCNRYSRVFINNSPVKKRSELWWREMSCWI